MTNTRTVATGNAKEVTKTTCRECGFSIQSENEKMVACPECQLIQWAGPSCLNRSGERQCVLAGSHSGSCDFSGALQCKTHRDHAYTRHSCGHQFCDRYWKSCPRCFGRFNFEANLKVAKATGSLVSGGQLIGAYCEPCADVIMREYGEKLGEVWGFAPYDYAGHPPNCIRCEGVR